MRILMLTRFSCSGHTGHLLSLAAELKRQGTDTVVVMTDCPAPLVKQYAEYCRNRVPFSAQNNEAEIGHLIRRERISLLHLHSPALLTVTRRLSKRYSLPWGFSIHSEALPAALTQRAVLTQAAFIAASDPSVYRQAHASGLPVSYIPEGIDLQQFKPASRNNFKIAYIAETGSYDENCYLALIKAAGLADLPVEIAGPEHIPQAGGRFHGWPPSNAPLLRGTQIVAGRQRGLLEGMACGNAALILGRSYRGILEPDAARSSYPDLSSDGSDEPCYRNIFYDLSRLLKNRPYLTSLQQWGRQFVTEHCDIRLTARLAAKLYGGRR